jgi:signal transduction histidine kinase
VVQNHSEFSLDTTSLLMEWREERASRVVFAMSRIGAVLVILSFILDFIYKVPAIVFWGDVGLVVGFCISIYFSSTKHRRHTVAWSSLYISLWFACSTSLATSGGMDSPFNGSYWALLYLAGLLIQSQFSATQVTAFIVANLGGWMLLEKYFPKSFGSHPPIMFSFLLNCLVFAGLYFFVAEFMKTEKQLGNELLRRYKELHRTREDLSRQEEANAAKSTFLANISHELRTPLGAILGYAELMQAPDIETQQKEKFADTIHRNGLQLSRLVDDLLDLSKAEAGKIELEPIEFKLRAAINEVLDLFQITAQQKGLSLEGQFQEPLPENIISDPLRFKQILRNILGNAIKFTASGQVKLTASMIASGQNKSLLQIEIEDSGCGLTADEQRRIFRSFTQADASVTRKFGGTGLGLSLSQNLAQILGGSLFLAWSEKNVGSCFVLQLPLPPLEMPKSPENIQNFFTAP